MTPETENQALEAYEEYAKDHPSIYVHKWSWLAGCKWMEARGRASGQQVVEGYCCMPKELTAENGAKAALIGEFIEETQYGAATIRVPVSWTTIKEIYKAAVAHFAASPQITSPAEKPEDVIAICTAYESGYGHGVKDDKLPSPYKYGSMENSAYVYGYEEGRRSGAAQPSDSVQWWQPISTAPQDGTAILTVCGHNFSVRYWGEGDDDVMAWQPRIRGVFPTHWMPLPPEPPGGT